MTSDDLSTAVVRWTGWRVSMSPIRDDAVLIAEYGADCALDLVAGVHMLEGDFYRSNANLTAPDLHAMGEQAATEFRARHPGISDEAVAALAWCYTYDYK